MKNNSFFLTALLAAISLSIYLFVSAPPPLPEATASDEPRMPVAMVLTIMQQENALIRKLWTAEIVGPGKKQGLAFNEKWKEPGMEAGPLPALFLRETALRLEKTPARLSLFLGSDAPINEANRFDEAQGARFAELKRTGKPQFFYAEDIGRYTALFPDIAAAPACVECHNAHPQSPKKDWVLGDVMGATTWLYPDEAVPYRDVHRILGTLRGAFRDTYSAYLKKASGFARPPAVGDRWPRDGYFLPSVDAFMEEFERSASSRTVQSFLDSIEK